MTNPMDGLEHFFSRLATRINAIPTAKLLLCLIGVFLLWRFVTLDFIEKSGDAVWKWSFLRYYVVTGEWFPAVPDHHQGRWAINLPVFLLMKLFGDDPWVYYIFPLLTALGTGIFLFLIATELRSKAAGTAAFLIALLFPLTVRESTQFLPMLPAACFALAAAWLLLRHIKTGKLTPVFFSGLLIGISYGCKVTSLYWAAGFLLFMTLWPSDRKTFFRIWKFQFGPGCFLFGLGLLAVLAAETVFFYLFFGVTGGLPEIIFGSHISNRVRPEYLNFFEYLFSFIRPLDLGGKYFDLIPHVMLLVGGVAIACLWLFRGGKPQRFLAVAFLTAYLLHSYVVYKFFPFLHPEKTHARYFLIVAAVAMILCTAGWKDGFDQLKKWFPSRTVTTFLGIAVAMVVLMMLIRTGNQWSRGHHPIAVFQVHRHLAMANREHIPVLMKPEKPELALSEKMSDSDCKYGNMWLTFWGPVELLPKQNADRQLFFDENGVLWQLLLNGERFQPGIPQRIILLEKERLKFSTLTFRPAVVP